MRNFEDIKLEGNELKTLKFLNMEQCYLDNFEGFLYFKNFPVLEKLIFNRNDFKLLCKFEGFD